MSKKKQLLFFSDSTLILEGEVNLKREIIHGFRQESLFPRVRINGGYRLRNMTRDLAEMQLSTQTVVKCDMLLCVYQCCDYAYIPSSTSVGVVRNINKSSWQADIELFCAVAKRSSLKVLVVVCDAECFPAYHGVKEEYNTMVSIFRTELEKHGIAWCAGKELHKLPTCDGCHFDIAAAGSVIQFVVECAKSLRSRQDCCV